MIPSCPDCKLEDLEAHVDDSKRVVILRCSHCGWSLLPEGIQKLNDIKAWNAEDFYSQLSRILEAQHESVRV